MSGGAGGVIVAGCCVMLVKPILLVVLSCVLGPACGVGLFLLMLAQ